MLIAAHSSVKNTHFYLKELIKVVFVKLLAEWSRPGKARWNGSSGQTSKLKKWNGLVGVCGELCRGRGQPAPDCFMGTEGQCRLSYGVPGGPENPYFYVAYLKFNKIWSNLFSTLCVSTKSVCLDHFQQTPNMWPEPDPYHLSSTAPILSQTNSNGCKWNLRTMTAVLYPQAWALSAWRGGG